MTYKSTEPTITDSWDDICYPVQPLWLSDLLPDYDIMATDRQQLIVGQMPGGRKTMFGIQSADYTIIPNQAIREVIDRLVPDYQLLIKHTITGEFNITIILPATLPIGGEELHRSLILTNSYNGRTPFSIQGQTLTTLLEPSTHLGSSMYRNICQNGLMGWADTFTDLHSYQNWLQYGLGDLKKKAAQKAKPAKERSLRTDPEIRKLHHNSLTIERFQEHLHDLLVEHLTSQNTLTASVYQQLQQAGLSNRNDSLLRNLSVPVQLIKQAHERLRLEERLLGVKPSYWLLYNAINYVLFSARSSLTLNDRYRLDEKTFHSLAAHALA
ncbi:hypothetical protein [Telluribacter sp. SYSU D00476]|uniref:hypothetical protein n=1 Tax=Telluribacter sp. SYSU D00476 TaxID=2811430 RepID=UPI001FF17C9D|nr:hypothetical protein [Telluribacter sp. SYSU D00476]